MEVTFEHKNTELCTLFFITKKCTLSVKKEKQSAKRRKEVQIGEENLYRCDYSCAVHGNGVQCPAIGSVFEWGISGPE